MITNNNEDKNINYAVLEQASKQLKTESRFSLSVEKRHSSNSVDSKFAESNIRSAFRDLVIDSASQEELSDLYASLEIRKSTHSLVGITDRAFASIAGLSEATAYQIIAPSRGDFEWDKKDWESRDAEVEAFSKHVEKVIFKISNYRLNYGQAKKA